MDEEETVRIFVEFQRVESAIKGKCLMSKKCFLRFTRIQMTGLTLSPLLLNL